MGVKALFNLEGRVAVVTGGSRGIGRAIALGLAEFGADVVVTCGAHLAAAEDVAGEIRAMGRRAGVVQASLASDDGAQRTFDGAVAAMGRVDILVLNASIQLPTPWLSVSREQFDQQLAVNLRSSFELMQRCAPPMAERKWGRILTVGSVQEAKPHPDMIVYAATKSALESMTRNLAKQLGPGGITVNNLAPGTILTDRNINRLDNPEYRERVLNMIPVRTFGDPEDCVGAAVLICSQAGRYINGANLYVDGGMKL